MEEYSHVPEGKTVRYLCDVPRCHSPRKTFSLFTLIEHIASHYRHSIGSPNHANYRCKNCGHSFYLLCMTMSCFCRQYGGENECVSLKADWNRERTREDVAFLWYVVQHAVPVLVEKAANPGCKRLPTPQTKAEGFNTPLMRSPSTYNDRTPRTPHGFDEEKREPAHARALRNMSSCTSICSVQVESVEPKQERSGRKDEGTPRRTSAVRSPTVRSPTVRSPQWRSRQDSLLLENPSPPRTPRKITRSPGPSSLQTSRSQPSSHSSTKKKIGDHFGSGKTIPPWCPQMLRPTTVTNSSSLTTFSGSAPIFVPTGPYQTSYVPPSTHALREQFYGSSSAINGYQHHLWHPALPQSPFTTIQESSAPYMGQFSNTMSSERQPNPTANVLAPKQKERRPRTILLETVPPYSSPGRHEVVTPKRRRRSSRRRSSDSS